MDKIRILQQKSINPNKSRPLLAVLIVVRSSSILSLRKNHNIDMRIIVTNIRDKKSNFFFTSLNIA
jgi:hypothetical protein